MPTKAELECLDKILLAYTHGDKLAVEGMKLSYMALVSLPKFDGVACEGKNMIAQLLFFMSHANRTHSTTYTPLTLTQFQGRVKSQIP